MTGMLIRFAFAAGGLWGASQLIPGISVDGVGSLLAAALILGVINAILRPVLILLTLPITIVTLGLFLLVINALIIMIAGAWVKGFVVDGFWWALIFSILLSVISSILEKIVTHDETTRNY